MILFKIDIDHTSVDKSERHSPWTIHRDGETFWFPLKRMEVPTGDVQVFRHRGLLERIE